MNEFSASPPTPSAILVPGARLWLTKLWQRPLLNGERCILIATTPPASALSEGSLPSSCIVHRTISADDYFTVGAHNLTDVPSGDEACVSVRAVLARVLTPILSARVVAFLTCPRCWEPCASRTPCAMPHPDAMATLDHDGSHIECGLCETTFRNNARVRFDGGHAFSCAGDGSDCLPCVLPEYRLCQGKEHYFTRQQKISALPAYVESLSLVADMSYPDGSLLHYGLGDGALPNLKFLTLNLVDLDVNLNSDLTPKLQEINIISSHLEGRISHLHSLKRLTVLSADADWLPDVIRTATDLIVCSISRVRLLDYDEDDDSLSVFEFGSSALVSLKLKGVPYLERIRVDAPNLGNLIIVDCCRLRVLSGFDRLPSLEVGGFTCLPVLEEVHLSSFKMRTLHLDSLNALQAVILWAPSLTALAMYECQAIKRVTFLSKDDFGSALPQQYSVPELQVSFANCNEEVLSDIKKHPNCCVTTDDLIED